MYKKITEERKTFHKKNLIYFIYMNVLTKVTKVKITEPCHILLSYTLTLLVQISEEGFCFEFILEEPWYHKN
jgi:hypothetical protein